MSTARVLMRVCQVVGVLILVWIVAGGPVWLVFSALGCLLGSHSYLSRHPAPRRRVGRKP